MNSENANNREEDNMKPTHYVAILAILNAMLLCYTNSSAQAGEGKGNSARRVGKAGSHMSSKGLDNTNAQWSADPDRGWIRADELHELHDQRQTTPKAKQNLGKNKGQSKKGKESSESRN